MQHARQLRGFQNRAAACRHIGVTQWRHDVLGQPGRRWGSALANAAAAEGTTAPTLEGRLIPGLQLGPLAMLQQRLRVGQQGFTLIMPADVDAVIDLYVDAGINDGDPYWTRVWPSSIALASLILSRPDLVRGKKVADIGCGLGLAGMAAALCGASEVVLLDREPLALHCALLSAAATGLAGSVAGLEPEPLQGWAAASASAAPAAGSKVAAAAVSKTLKHIISGVEAAAAAAAGSEVTRAAAAPGTSPAALDFRLEGGALEQFFPQASAPANVGATGIPTVRARVFDWTRAELLKEKFDVLLACDVLYEDVAVQPIAELVPRLLSSQHGSRLLLADPPTRTVRNRDRFLQLLQDQQQGTGKLVVEECSIHNCESQQLDNEMAGGLSASQAIPIQLMLLRQSLGGDTVSLKGI